jgi:hypothetical protein
MTASTDIQFYEILRQKLGNAEAEAIVSLVDTKIKQAEELNLKLLATKEDLSNVKCELSKDISESKDSMVKWVFGFFVVLVGMIVGLYFRK